MSTREMKTALQEPSVAPRELTMAEAIKEALAEEMRRDPRVFIMGEDVAEAGTVFKVLSGLSAEFGTERVIDTPISEAGFAGLGRCAVGRSNAQRAVIWRRKMGTTEPEEPRTLPKRTVA